MQRFIFLMLFFYIIAGVNAQPVYTVPWASQQPKFVFPIYFEEATGMRDTVYICYDPQAQLSQPNIIDTIFGQRLIFIDTTKFYANFPYCNPNPIQCDSVYKIAVSPLTGGGQFPNSMNTIGFHNGQLPLKISWDISTLYSDSLPFPVNPGLPRAQGRFNSLAGSPFIKLRENGQVTDVSLWYDILLTDTGLPAFKDSCTAFSIDANSHPVEEILIAPIYFERWTGVVTSVESDELKNDFSIFPNPNSGILNFETKLFCESGLIQVSDLSGRIVFRSKISNFTGIEKISLDLSDGAYIFIYYCSDNFHIKLFSFSK